MKGIEIEKLRHSLTLLRDARALVLRDAESFHEASTVLEHIGQILCGEVKDGLSHYKDSLIQLALEEGHVTKDQVSRLFKVILNSRNSAVHDGAWARHVSVKLIDLLLILEGGVLNKMEAVNSKNEQPTLLVEDIMVRSPVIAEDWQMVAHVRREMLGNSFSNLPILWNGVWHVITDNALMQFLRSSADYKECRSRRNKLIGNVISSEVNSSAVKVLRAETCSDQAPISEAVGKLKAAPVVLVLHEGCQNHLVGILSAFDLL